MHPFTSEQEKQALREHYLQVLADGLEEEAPSPLTDWPLQTPEGREGFLLQFAWDGETALFQAVAHVWDSLAPPRLNRTIKMGQVAGSGGSGKVAIAMMLLRFLEEYLERSMQPLPEPGDVPLPEWHERVMTSFRDCDADLATLARRYAHILDGGG